MIIRVHLLLDAPPLQRRLRRFLPKEGVVVTTEGDHPGGAAAADLTLVREALLEGRIRDLVDQLAGAPQGGELIVLTASQDPAHRTQLLGLGVSSVLGIEDPDAVIAGALTRILADRSQRMLLQIRAAAGARLGELGELVSRSPRMQEFIRVVRKVVPSETTILIEGETGVGKERLARIIHHEGPRGGGPFVAVNCAAIPDALLESELFGHEQGAFTDAVRQKRGRFELAHGGTIFLDEIGDMPLHLQAKLLRVLQEREVERIGGEEPFAVDTRVLAATNQDLEAAMGEGRFRADLYYRLAVVTLRLPPLRERREDIPGLVQRFIERSVASLKTSAMTVEPAAMDALVRYSWPGNVRELINVIERAVLLAEGASLGVADLPEVFRGSEIAPPQSVEEAPRLHSEDLMSLPWSQAREVILARFEREYLSQALTRAGGRVGEAARAIGINPRSLYEKMRRLGFDKKAFRAED